MRAAACSAEDGTRPSGTLSKSVSGRGMTGLAAETDEVLMARIRAGDQAAYRTLVHRHLKRAYALARRMSGSDAEAEDIAQDAFLQVWQRRGHWTDEGAKFTTWLYRVVVNRCIDHKRRPAGEDLDSVPEPPDHAPDAVTHIQRRQVAARLRDAQDRLPPQQRAALALCYNEGLSSAEVATIMQISVTAVESLLKRARQQLRTLLRASAQAARDSFEDG
ncbi:RNA polymerase sigma factor [Azospirillum sp. YIM DDC1]|uniref:RNA polymerase sigma factor n=2 Tax=Azospirillum aestuarii TaxID=2802052 RepID=A0ABS1I7H2_9PROT|nr:RNA polymerase sigma factor [Azospirillum brasilense]MBK4722970.1 RNA polymerase sigma factor [Azospirillum aestuarii]